MSDPGTPRSRRSAQGRGQDFEGGERPLLGTAAWLTQTRGVLTLSEQAHFMAQALQAQSARLVELIKSTRSSPYSTAISLDELARPDTPLTRYADARTSAMPPYLVNHSHRTYLWAAVWAMAHGTAYDAEALYVAALLHDLGLTLPSGTGRECFTLTGVNAVRDAHALSNDEQTLAASADAIAMHLHARPPDDACVEAKLLAAGAALDVIGLGISRLPPATVVSVLEAYPRLDFKREFPRLWSRHAKAFKRGRANALRLLGLRCAIQIAPF